MVFSKNFLLVLLVLSTITLCLAKPRWVWLDEKDDGDWNDEVLTGGKNKLCFGSIQLPHCIKHNNKGK
jgi:hypothetical protein